MAHEILSVKLCQLDERIGRLHSRISLSDTAGHSRLQREIDTMEKECQETDLMMQKKLQCSKSPMVSVLARGYEEIETGIQKTREDFQRLASQRESQESSTEEKILLAEYALDFAMQGAEHALLLSMQAIEAQMTQQEQEENII